MCTVRLLNILLKVSFSFYLFIYITSNKKKTKVGSNKSHPVHDQRIEEVSKFIQIPIKKINEPSPSSLQYFPMLVVIVALVFILEYVYNFRKMSKVSMGPGTHEIPMTMFKENRERVCAALRNMNNIPSNAEIYLEGGDNISLYNTDVDHAFRQVIFFIFLISF